MPHDRQLQKVILAELRDSNSVLGARVVVTAVAGSVVLGGQVESFAEKYAAALLVASIAGVDKVTDDLEVRLYLEPDSRFLLAARRVMTDAPAMEPSTTGPTGNTLTATLVDGLLTVTGEIDWRRRANLPKEGDAGSNGYEAASNISDDILRMLPRCFFSTSRTHR
jgi:hypothetical protein